MTVELADGNYPITANCYALRNGVTDFFGNPRATPGKKVSIGYCQAPNPGLMLLMR